MKAYKEMVLSEHNRMCDKDRIMLPSKGKSLLTDVSWKAAELAQNIEFLMDVFLKKLLILCSDLHWPSRICVNRECTRGIMETVELFQTLIRGRLTLSVPEL